MSDANRCSVSQGAMVALPILSGACLRVFAGLLADRIGARRTALAGLGLTALPLVLGWLWVGSVSQLATEVERIPAVYALTRSGLVTTLITHRQIAEHMLADAAGH